MIKNFAQAYVACYRRHFGYVVAVLLLTAVFTIVNVVTMVSDYERVGLPLDFGKPVLYELSSAIAIMALVPLIVLTGERWPSTQSTWYRYLPYYFGASLAFSAGHILIMVLIRMAVYPMLYDGPYDFFYRGLGAIPYEYWKDLRSFLLLFGGFALVGDALRHSRLNRLAAPQLELRSGATRILIDPKDFLFAKGAANYAEIVTGTGESLARITLAELEDRLANEGVPAVRIHRSCLVNKAMIHKIDPVAGGDLMLTLKGGQALRASRRYKDRLLNPDDGQQKRD